MPQPPEHIVNELKSIDSNLTAHWNKKAQRFMVLHKDKKNKVYPVMRVQYKDGSYKPLDQRTVKALKYSNHLRNKRPQDILYDIDYQNEENEKKKMKQVITDGKSIAKDMPKRYVNIGGF